MEHSGHSEGCGCGRHHGHRRVAGYGMRGHGPWRHHPEATCGCDERTAEAHSCECGCEDADHANEGCTCACHEHPAAADRCACGCEDTAHRREGCACGCHEQGEDGQACRCGMHLSPPHHFVRRFITREERIAILEQYLESLRLEAKGVDERIADLKAKG